MKKNEGADLVLVPVTKLVPHPDNPRVALREDVITALAANMGADYPKKHAIHVRQIGDTYQILSGHQRTEAAKRKGLEHVWAWVDSLDDAAAFMELVTSNNQGELSPLEIGIHALKAVPKAEGGRGKKGGLSEYAERIGKSKSHLTELINAAKVAETVRLTEQFLALTEKATHLAVLHGLPKACWPSACQWLAVNDAPVKDVEARVEQAMKFHKEFNVAAGWSAYLHKDDCTGAVFTGTAAGNFLRLADLAEEVYQKLGDKHDDLAQQWRSFLLGNAGGSSWDIKAVQAKRIELEQVAWDRDHGPEKQEQPEVSVILADPPWQYDFAETDSRQVENQYPTATVEEISSHIDAPWAPPLAKDCVLFLWATAPKLPEALAVMEAWGFTYKTNAVWDKEKIGMGYWFRGQHELLLVGTRGAMSPPDTKQRVSSVFREERGKHSQKPACVYAAIEAMFPEAVRCEFYQRAARDGWKGVGNES